MKILYFIRQIEAVKGQKNQYLEVGELTEVAKAPPELWLPVIDAVDTGFFTWKKGKGKKSIKTMNIIKFALFDL